MTNRQKSTSQALQKPVVSLYTRCPRCGVDALGSLSSTWADPQGTCKYDCGTVMTDRGHIIVGDYCDGGRFDV